MASDALRVGQPAPDFELMNQDKTVIKLRDFRGKKKVALLFYPMDFSPTCTSEFCSFGAAPEKVNSDPDTVVFGVSCDSPFCHAEFKKKYKLPYDLLADVTRKMVKAYGMFAGEEPYNCSKRGTVVIDKNGNITHYEEVAMREPREPEKLAQAIVADALANRAEEFGESTGSSR